MPQSLSKIYIHLIFHIKSTSPRIKPEDLDRVHSYIGQLINETGCVNIWVNGVGDHVHALFLLSRDISISKLVEEIKRNSSRWIKSISFEHYKDFEWQGGYAALSVSQSVVDPTLEYIKNQQEHHRKRTFQEEYIEFLKLYDIQFDERYVFRD